MCPQVLAQLNYVQPATAVFMCERSVIFLGVRQNPHHSIVWRPIGKPACPSISRGQPFLRHFHGMRWNCEQRECGSGARPKGKPTPTLQACCWTSHCSGRSQSGFLHILSRGYPVVLLHSASAPVLRTFSSPWKLLSVPASSKDKNDWCHWCCISSPGNFWIKASCSAESHENVAVGNKLPTKTKHKNIAIAVTKRKITEIRLGQSWA